MDNIADKVVVTTDASIGHGAKKGHHLVNAGANVALEGVIRLDQLKAMTHELGFDDYCVLRIDVTDRQQVKTFVELAIKPFCRIIMDINSILRDIASALQHFKAQKAKQFTTVSSFAGRKVGIGSAIYSASKETLRMTSEWLYQKDTPCNIYTSVLSPNTADTELSASDKTKGVVRFYDSHAIPSSSYARCAMFTMSQPDDLDIKQILFHSTKQNM